MRPRSLDDLLASVMEGGSVVYAGDGMSLVTKPTSVDVTRNKRRRRRTGRSRERAQTFASTLSTERQPNEIGIPVSITPEELEEAKTLPFDLPIHASQSPQDRWEDAVEFPQDAAPEAVLSAADESLSQLSEEDARAILHLLHAEAMDEHLAALPPEFDPEEAVDVSDVAEDAPVFVSASAADARDEIADLDRAVISYGEPFNRSFRDRAVPIRFAEHARSPFVVSLRGLDLGMSGRRADEKLAQQKAFYQDQRQVTELPDLELLESLAQDLAIDDADGVRYADQFTPSTFATSYRRVYGPVTRFLNGIGRSVDQLLGFITVPAPRRTRAGERRSAEQQMMGSASGDDGGDVMDDQPVVLPPRQPASPRVRMRVPVSRTVVVMGALALVAMLPANAVRLARSLETKKADVTAAGTVAIADLQNAASMNLSTSIEALRRASNNFRAADASLSNTNAVAVALANVIPQTRSSYASARALLEVGSKSSDAGRLLAKGLDSALTGQGRGIIDRLGVLSAYAESALPLLDDAARLLATVDPSALPEQERSKISTVQDGLDTGRLAVREFIGTSELLARLLGRDAPRRFLVVFQNPNELRPTGGFMGSYAELDVDRGEIQRFTIPAGGTYDVQGQLVKQIIPPQPLQLVANRWEFQDSNWSPDFPTAAGQINQLWSASGGYTIDGVIAINATVFADLLKITGPIDVPELGKTLTSDNAIDEIEKSAELEYDKTENKPKKILSLAGPRLIEKLKLLSPDQFMTALGVLSDAVTRKEIQIALMDPDENALAQGFEWSGRLKQTSGDSLAVIGANIAGGKTGAVVHEQIAQQTTIGEDGRIVDQVTVERTHTGVKHTPLTGVRNVTYFRFYVPLGSTLLSADGFATSPRALLQTPREDAQPDPQIAAEEKTQSAQPGFVDQWDEGDRTVFGGWSLVDPGQEATVAVSYRLPFTAFDLRSRLSPQGSADVAAGNRAAYSLLLTSQSGTDDRTITSRVTVPSTWKTSWSRDLGSSSPTLWDRDRVVSSLYEMSSP